MNGVKFIRENGGLARILQGTDYTSGLLVYGEPSVGKVLLLSPEEMADKGISITANPVLFYHVSEFFRINEGAKLYVQSIPEADGNFDEIKVLQNYAEGNIKQLGVCDFKTGVAELTNRLAKLNQVANELASGNTPLSILYSCKLTALDLPNLPDLHTQTAERVSVIIAQDKGGLGGYLSTTNPSIGNIGTVLGATAKALVHESIGWVEKQNLVNIAYEKALTNNLARAKEMDVVGFCDGSTLGDYTPQQLQSIHDKGYLFCVKYAGRAGTYYNDSFTATTLESDFAYIENNRTIDKAVRGINDVLLPKVSGPAYIDADTGLLDASTSTSLEALCDDVLDQMKRDGEISGYQCYINPNQQVLRTSKLEVVLKIVPVGTLREIEVKIGLTLKNN